jgi:hypothetical protein
MGERKADDGRGIADAGGPFVTQTGDIRESKGDCSVDPPMPASSTSSRVFRRLRHIVFDASRAGRCAEIAGWSNAVAGLGLAGGVFALTRSWPVSIGAAIAMFVLLRAALTHRLTIWVAAAFGTLAVSAAGGGLAWLFAHVLESSSTAPSIAGVLGAVGAAILPAWAYGRLAQRREHVRDSLLDPLSVPSSRS